MSIYNATEFARRVGVSVKTLQRWDREGRLKPLRTPTNRRMYTDEHLSSALHLRSGAPLHTVAYLRVTDEDHGPAISDLRAGIEAFCAAHGLAVDEWVAEIGNADGPRSSELMRLLATAAGDAAVVIMRIGAS